jgi:F-type H+-transporting ATPase subunit delta
MAQQNVSAKPAHVLEDPSAASVARVYAVALLDAAQAQGASDVLEELQSFVTDVLTPQPAFERLLCAPVTPVEDKLGFIDRVVASRGSPLFVNFLKVLARHNRLDVLRAVADAAQREQETRRGQRRVQVSSAVPLSAAAQQAIVSSLQSVLSAEPILEEKVDPSLVGGLVIRVGDTVYDGSVRNRLKQLRARLRERCLHEVQRGRDRFSHSEGN